MPQTFRVLKCFKCGMFQGDQVKKAPKWNCKLCGEKQSVMQEFGTGTGKECRELVQKFNMKTHQEELHRKQEILKCNELQDNNSNDENVNNYLDENVDKNMSGASKSKWSELIPKEKDEYDQELQETNDTETTNIFLENSFRDSNKGTKRSYENSTIKTSSDKFDSSNKKSKWDNLLEDEGIEN